MNRNVLLSNEFELRELIKELHHYEVQTYFANELACHPLGVFASVMATSATFFFLLFHCLGT